MYNNSNNSLLMTFKPSYQTLTVGALLFPLFGSHTHVSAQDFETNFVNETLRLDYILAGDATHQAVYLHDLHASPTWYGKRQRLSEAPVLGNGEVVVTDSLTADTIYFNTFSTLFQEWQTYPEAVDNPRSFEFVQLIPMPKQIAMVTLTLRDNYLKPVVSVTHVVDPKDILIQRHTSLPSPHTLIHEAEAGLQNPIDIAFVAEGYTQEQMPRFIEKVREATKAIFDHEPFTSYANRFNIWAVMSPSTESGTNEPAKGVWKHTALESHFDTFHSDRYLTTQSIFRLHDALNGLPYEHIIVLVNTAEYGGGGILNMYNLSMTENAQFCPVVVHEFGHSFAGLADEYAYADEPLDIYPDGIEPWEPNITRQIDFASKWADMVGQEVPEQNCKVGLYEGGGYMLKGIWRPTKTCRMRDNSIKNFCPVCQRAIANVIKFYTE